MTKFHKDRIENGEILNFPLKFSYAHLKPFSRNFKVELVFAQTRNELQLDFLFAYKIMKDFQRHFKLSLFLLKLAFKLKIRYSSRNFQKIVGFL